MVSRRSRDSDEDDVVGGVDAADEACSLVEVPRRRSPSCCSMEERSARRGSSSTSVILSTVEWLHGAKARETHGSNHRAAGSILLGQLIAVIATSTNATSFALSYQYGVRTHLFQLFWVYLFLSMHLFYRDVGGDEDGEQRPRHNVPFTRLRLRIPWQVYSLCGVLDVVPNFLTLLSFQYTSLTSTTLLGSLTVPSTMFFSRLILARVFSRRQYLGVVLCVLGGAFTVWSDTGANGAGAPDQISTIAAPSLHDPHRYVGDLMAIGAAVLYALGDTVADYSIKHGDRYEYLGMLGLNGLVLTGLSFPWLEGNEVHDLLFHDAGGDPWVGTWTVFVLYVASVVIFYVSVAHFLVSADATLLVLSLQTSNLWAVLFSMIAYRIVPAPLFYVAAALVVSGAVIYQRSAEKKAVADVASQDEEGRNEALSLTNVDSNIYQGAHSEGVHVDKDTEHSSSGIESAALNIKVKTGYDTIV